VPSLNRRVVKTPLIWYKNAGQKLVKGGGGRYETSLTKERKGDCLDLLWGGGNCAYRRVEMDSKKRRP